MNGFFKNKRNILVVAQAGAAVVAFFTVLIIFVGNVFGWFTQNNFVKLDPPTLEVMPGEKTEGIIDAGLFESSSGQVLERAYLFPGEYIKAQIKITNNTDSQKTYKITFSKLTVHYPEFSATTDEQWQPFYRSDNYSDISGGTVEKWSAESISDAMDYTNFQSFVAPVTNALEFELYTADRASFFNQTTAKTRLSANYPNATSAEIAAGEKVWELDETTSPAINVCTEAMVDGSTVLNSSPTLTLAASGEATLWLLIYFNPETYTQADLTLSSQTHTVKLQNSNMYIGQQVDIQFDLIAQ